MRSMKAIKWPLLGVLLSGALVLGQGASSPSVSLALQARQAKGTPIRIGCTHTGGGNTDVAQPAPDTLVITMTGVAVAGPHPCKVSSAALDFDLVQQLEVAFDKPEVKKAKITLEGRLI